MMPKRPLMAYIDTSIINSVRVNSQRLKYHEFTLSVCKDIGINFALYCIFELQLMGKKLKV